jgi:hypothetical protein
MLQVALIVIAVLAGLLAIYAAAMASWSLSRDTTLTFGGRNARYLIVWLVPFVGAGWVLRSAADLAPDSLPPLRLLRPLVPLFHISRVQYNALANRNDLVTYGSHRGPHD